MHYFLSGNQGSVHKTVIPDWCDFHQDSVMVIPAFQKVIWNSRKFLHGNLIIQPEAELIVNCIVHLPQDASVTIQRGGKLTLGKNGKLTNVCMNQKWLGLIIKGKASKRNNAIQIPDMNQLINCRQCLQYSRK